MIAWRCHDAERVGWAPAHADFFTTKDGTLYVITPRWPGEKLVVKDVEVSPDTAVTKLGLAQSIRWDRSGSDVTIHVPALSVDEVPCQYAYVFRITHVK